jgi:anti-sigma factor RsiW
MNCDEVRRSVQDYVTRELSPENRRLFDAHLVGCAECQRELALMTAVVSTLDHQPVLEPPPGFGERVLASLPRRRGYVPSPWWSLALAPLLVGVAFLFRGPVLRLVSGWLGQVGPSHVTVPSFTLQQAGLAAAAVVLAGVAVAVGAGACVWQVYLRD